MNLKQKIIQDFLNDDLKNFTAFNTDAVELGRMYDQVIEYSKLPQKNWFERLLIETKAITHDGKIRFDREALIYDKESKKDIKVKSSFRFPVFNYLKSRWQEAMDNIKAKNEEALNSATP